MTFPSMEENLEMVATLFPQLFSQFALGLTLTRLCLIMQPYLPPFRPGSTPLFLYEKNTLKIHYQALSDTFSITC